MVFVQGCFVDGPVNHKYELIQTVRIFFEDKTKYFFYYLLQSIHKQPFLTEFLKQQSFIRELEQEIICFGHRTDDPDLLILFIIIQYEYQITDEFHLEICLRDPWEKYAQNWWNLESFVLAQAALQQTVIQSN